jgi:hypothetical protein
VAKFHTHGPAPAAGPFDQDFGQRMNAHHRLRRLAPASLAALALVLVLAACSSSGSKHNPHIVRISASTTYSDATALATALHKAKLACGTPTAVTKLSSGVKSEVTCAKTKYGMLDVVVFSGTTVPSSWTASYHHLCGSSSAATHYVSGKNWAIVASSDATGNSGMDRLGHQLKIATKSFCS